MTSHLLLESRWLNFFLQRVKRVSKKSGVNLQLTPLYMPIGKQSKNKSMCFFTFLQVAAVQLFFFGVNVKSHCSYRLKYFYMIK